MHSFKTSLLALSLASLPLATPSARAADSDPSKTPPSPSAAADCAAQIASPADPAIAGRFGRLETGDDPVLVPAATPAAAQLPDEISPIALRRAGHGRSFLTFIDLAGTCDDTRFATSFIKGHGILASRQPGSPFQQALIAPNAEAAVELLQKVDREGFREFVAEGYVFAYLDALVPNYGPSPQTSRLKDLEYAPRNQYSTVFRLGLPLSENPVNLAREVNQALELVRAGGKAVIGPVSQAQRDEVLRLAGGVTGLEARSDVELPAGSDGQARYEIVIYRDSISARLPKP